MLPEFGTQNHYYVTKDYILHYYIQHEGDTLRSLYIRQKLEERVVNLKHNIAFATHYSESMLGNNGVFIFEMYIGGKRIEQEELILSNTYADTSLYHLSCVEVVKRTEHRDVVFNAHFQKQEHQVFCESSLLDTYFLRRGDWAVLCLKRENIQGRKLWLFQEFSSHSSIRGLKKTVHTEISKPKIVTVKKSLFEDILDIPLVSKEEYTARIAANE